MSLEIQIAIIAASSAILGSVISQITAFALSFFEKKHQRQVHLRQKYEEMTFYFSDSLQWLPIVHNCRTRAQLSSCAQSPDARKALSLCLLYFPELKESANDYILAQQSYYRSVIEKFNDAIDVSAGAQAFSVDGHEKVLNDFFKRKNTFENLIVDTAKKYVET